MVFTSCGRSDVGVGVPQSSLPDRRHDDRPGEFGLV